MLEKERWLLRLIYRFFMKKAPLIIVGVSSFILGLLIPRGGDSSPAQSDSESLSSSLRPREGSESLQSDSVVQLRRAFSDLDPTVSRDLLQQSEKDYQLNLLLKLMDVDPAAAATHLSLYQESSEFVPLTQQLMEAWGRKDPLAAFNWLSAQNGDYEEGEHPALVMGLLSDAARFQPEQAELLLPLIDGPEAEDQKAFLTQQLAQAWADLDSEKAFAWLGQFSEKLDLDSVSDDDLSETYIQVLQKCGKREPEKVAWMVSQLDSVSLQRQVVESVAASFADQNPAEAIRWVRDLSDSESMTQAITAIMIDGKKEVVSEVLQELSAEIQTEERFREVFSFAASSHPELAASYLESASPEVKAEGVRLTASSWYVQDPEKAQQWAAGLKGEPVFDLAADEISKEMSQTHQKPKLALEWAGQIEDEAIRFARAMEIVQESGLDRLPPLDQLLEQVPLSAEQAQEIRTHLTTRIAKQEVELVLPE